MGSEAEVVIVDGDREFTSSLADALRSVGIHSLVHERAADSLEGDPVGETRTPGCLILDFRLPGMSGLELRRTLVQKGLRRPVLFVSSYADVSSVVSAFRLGAFDVFEKPVDFNHLIDSVQRAIDADRKRIDLEERRREPEQRIRSLSSRELQVLKHVVEGRSIKETARLLSVSVKTIESDRSRIKNKLDSESLAECMWVALRAQAPTTPPSCICGASCAECAVYTMQDAPSLSLSRSSEPAERA